MATETRTTQGAPPPGGVSFSLSDPTFRAIVYQILVVGAVVLVGWFLISNTLDNLARRSIATGYHFLEREAAFGIGESLIDYSPKDTYGRAFLVGVLNTLKVSIIGVILATIIGTIIGVARLSSNWLIAKLASTYVEIIRNIPPLLQLFFWYALVSDGLPPVRQALNPIPGVFLSQRGLRVPVPAPDPVWANMGIALLVAIVAAWGVSRWARARQARTGQPFPAGWTGLGLIVGLPILTWLAGGAPLAMDVPKLTGFNFTGGGAISPEFFAILTGLTLYTAAFIAEVVRSGIKAVNWGQTEAARALGLPSSPTLRLVILPQALRVIVPPLTSQYLNLTKNSSLALAIGYPDLVSIANTTLNQTGQAIEGVTMIMGTYLVISLSISIFMNWYNKRIALVER
ncbi:general L-amino acid transport system permease protein [Azospirillum lipoferum]|uniref:Amino acid ABC transporter permease n=1 Tax=Azospirillum lipoferum TaxID=193 RepID=A0A5A9GIQ0_AZOLI|nr:MULTISPECIES: amino acid ABC transporter permease [Azospirillum]KAA0593592.1 amino acid ABC transporter permease [Azospirillum lipoferum]MCP1608939.1 general L-amino acid transport system permease protein [Azospirillum lipoferum]MDW5535747.1 amino acid ABC transporter permease [Azospirillum sp. NL1]